MDIALAQAAGNHSSPCHNLEAVKLDVMVELTRMKQQIERLEEHRRRLNGHLESLDERTMEALREVQTLPTEVEQRAYAVANDLRGELTRQIQSHVGMLRTEWQTAEGVRQAAEGERQVAHKEELREARVARYKLYAGIGSTLILAATAAGPNALEILKEGAKLLFGGAP